MYSVGMRFQESLAVSTPFGFYVNLNELYCPYCGERGRTFGLVDSQMKLYNKMFCLGCEFTSSVPTGFIVNSLPFDNEFDQLKKSVATREAI